MFGANFIVLFSLIFIRNTVFRVYEGLQTYPLEAVQKVKKNLIAKVARTYTKIAKRLNSIY